MTRSNTDIPLLRGPVPLVHLLLRQFVRSGDQVVDATCGNGKDTLLLAELVGETGQVWAFDIQPEALERTHHRLLEAGVADRVTLLNQGHEGLATRVPAPVTTVVFNLGWLPGGDRNVVTVPETTLIALKGALQLLTPGGLLVITCYPGHQEGAVETDAVLNWLSGLDARLFHVWRTGQLNVSASAPFCLLVQKTVSTHAA
jgi:SAM-dependent methyltransferase